MSRRQEIDRGLRLAVNQNGEHVQDYNVNTLTVMANESYEEFVATLQKEIEAETGMTFGKFEKHVFAKLVYIDLGEQCQAVRFGLALELFKVHMGSWFYPE